MEQGYIFIANNIFPTLLAISNIEQERGLMHVAPPVPVMSFVYSVPRINRFWMHQTPAPLDIIFCHKGQISQICYGEPYSTKAIGDHQFSDLVIEFPYGTAAACDFKFGHSVGIVKPTVEELQKIIASKI